MHLVTLAIAVFPHIAFLGKLPLPPPRALRQPTPQSRATAQARDYFIGHNAHLTLAAEDVVPTPNGYIVHHVQTLRGVPIDDTYATALIRADHLIYANQALVTPPVLDTAPRVSIGAAQSVARQSMQDSTARITDVGTPRLLVTANADIFLLVWRVPVESAEPPASWNIDVDAQSGALVKIVKSSLEVATGQVRAAIEPTCEGDTTVSQPMPFIAWNTGRFADATGEFELLPDDNTAEVALRSPYLTLTDNNKKLPGPYTFALAPAPSHNELDLVDASLTHTDAFYSFHAVRSWLEDNAAPQSDQAAWVKSTMVVNVNLPRHCNAYYSPYADTLNFFSAGDDCINTARSPTVVYHEYGHAVLHHSGNKVRHSTALHEGYADVVAAFVSGQPLIHDINPGCTDTLRTCANTFSYCDHGCDYSADDEGHTSAQVICGAWWELRDRLAGRYGSRVGADITTRLFLQHLTLVGRDMTDTYAAAIATDADDDGDPSNGTLHSCEINAAYANSLGGAKPHFPDLEGMVPCHAP